MRIGVLVLGVRPLGIVEVYAKQAASNQAFDQYR